MQPSFFGERRNALLTVANRLADVVPERRAEVETALEHLRTNRFEIGVIGQIKSGKSTFLNALTERPGFLPVDVNPWTAVITRMYFGEGGQPEGSAIFRFFSRDEWSPITQRTSTFDRLREKVKKLGARPGDERDDARVEAERQKIIDRVGRRLGAELEQLLGRDRRFDGVTPEILEQFLCTGDDESAPLERPDAGKYSDITREAELYFAQAPFKDPCTLVDTPGTNDPFKARSAVTMRYLASADAYFMLLHGPQALSAQDVDILNKLLRGLHKERVVVFINRIDNFNDVSGDTRKVFNRVESWFRKQFPGLSIPVLTGCAWWAEQALRGDARAINRFINTQGVCEYGAERGFFSPTQFVEWEANPKAHVEEIRRAMMAVSGLPAARRAVEVTLLREKGQAILESGRNNLRAKAESFAADANMRADAAGHDAHVLEGDVETAQKELQRLDEEIHTMEQLRRELAEDRESGEQDLREVVPDALDQLATMLDQTVQAGALREANKLRGEGISFFDDETWAADVGEIRGEVEQVFLQQYRKARERARTAQERLRSRLRRAVLRVGDLGAVEIDATPAAEIDPRPSLGVLAEECEVELGDFLDRLFSFKSKTKKKALKLESAIRKSFSGPVEGLVASAGEALNGAVGATIKACEGAIQRALARIDADREERREAYQARMNETDPQATKEKIMDLRQDAEEMRNRAAALTLIAAELVGFQTS